MIEIKPNHIYRCVVGPNVLVLDTESMVERVLCVAIKNGVPDAGIVSRDRRELITPMHWVEGRPAAELLPMPLWQIVVSGKEPGEHPREPRGIKFQARMVECKVGIRPDSNDTIAQLEATSVDMFDIKLPIYEDELTLDRDPTGRIAAHAQRMARQMVQPTIEAYAKIINEKLTAAARKEGLIK